MLLRRFARPWLALAPVLLLGCLPAALAADGTVLINQATALHGLPGCNSTGLPIVICQPGSYRLSGNLTATDTDAINITADGVTLDLNGFTILQSDSGGVGINASSNAVSVSNGTVNGFEINVYLTGSGESVAAIRALNAGSVNIQIKDGAITGSSALGGGIGIRIEIGVVSNSLIEGGAHDGIEFADSGLAKGNTINNSATCLLASGGPVNAIANVFEANCGTGVSFANGGFFTQNTFNGVTHPSEGGTNGGGNIVYTGSITPPGWNLVTNH